MGGFQRVDGGEAGGDVWGGEQGCEDCLDGGGGRGGDAGVDRGEGDWVFGWWGIGVGFGWEGYVCVGKPVSNLFRKGETRDTGD